MATPTAHALLGASSAHRWIVCPPIIQLEASIQDEDTEYTLEGTAAHELAELKLQYQIGKLTKATFTKRFNKFKKTNEKYYCAEMDDKTDEYVTIVMERYNSYESASIELEKRVDFSKWVPEGFGTSDVVILADNMIEIIDLKYGAGVKVEAFQNPQIMLYALGAYATYDLLYDFKKIKMTIVQPRLDHTTTFTIDVEELLYWADNYVAPRAAQAIEGIGEWAITQDVVKFSKVRAQLRPRAEWNGELISKYDYKEAPLLEMDEIAEIIGRADEIIRWIDQVKNYALDQALKGVEVPGYKVVAGMSRRQIVSPDEVVTTLVSENYAHEDITETKLLPITKLQKVIGKGGLELINEFIVKPEGKPTLAPIADKRDSLALDTAANVFEVVE